MNRRLKAKLNRTAAIFLMLSLMPSYGVAGQRFRVMPDIPEGLSFERTVKFENEHESLTIVQPTGPKGAAPLAVMHDWLLCFDKPQNLKTHSKVESKVKDAKMFFHMPQHQHGLNTVPIVTLKKGPHNTNCIEAKGVRFQMPGWWQITAEINVEITTAAGADTKPKPGDSIPSSRQMTAVFNVMVNE